MHSTCPDLKRALDSAKKQQADGAISLLNMRADQGPLTRGSRMLQDLVAETLLQTQHGWLLHSQLLMLQPKRGFHGNGLHLAASAWLQHDAYVVQGCRHCCGSCLDCFSLCRPAVAGLIRMHRSGLISCQASRQGCHLDSCRPYQPGQASAPWMA